METQASEALVPTNDGDFPLCPQVQDSANHFQRVRDLYATLKSSSGSSQSCLRGCLEGLLGALHQTEAALTLPPNTTAQHIFNNNQKVS